MLTDTISTLEIKRKNIINLKKSELNVPVRHQVQETHFIVPASNEKMINYSLEGCRRCPGILEKNGISMEELSVALSETKELMEKYIDDDFMPDLILIDGEDATSRDPASIQKARINAGDFFRNVRKQESLYFYRPSSLDMDTCLEDILYITESAARNQWLDHFPLNGIIFPKVDIPDEIIWLDEVLGYCEKQNGIQEGSIKIQSMMESPAGLKNLYHVIKAGKDRLTGLVFGKADFASELALCSLDDDHPAILNARVQMIIASSEHGLAVTDSMTFEYPVADSQSSQEQKFERIIGAMKKVYEANLSARRLGMTGKWIGHPLQLLAVKLSNHRFYSDAGLERMYSEIKKYQGANDSGVGAIMMGGSMADRATDRKNRRFLRMAAINGYLALDQALNAGLLAHNEVDELSESSVK